MQQAACGVERQVQEKAVFFAAVVCGSGRAELISECSPGITPQERALVSEQLRIAAELILQGRK